MTDDPLFLKVGGVDFFIDPGAEKLLAAERNGKKIAVEIKSFLNTSSVADFHLAIGQFINYRTALKLKNPDRKLFLAIPDNAYDTFFQKEFSRLIIQEYQLELFIYDIKNEKIWLQTNNTELDIGQDLITMGVPKEDIVIGFQPVYIRQVSGYAIA